MAIDRRRFLVAAAGALVMPRPGFAAPQTGPAYLACARSAGTHRACLLDADGAMSWQVELPDRGHGGAFHPVGSEAIIFARRPGTFAIVFDRATGRVRHTLASPKGRHFYGHGTFSADGGLLYTTENDLATGDGIVGIWDATDGYRRVAEFASFGIGPHDIRLMPGGRQLAVANGGIMTHPDMGRQKLNIPDMKPSLVILDRDTGRLVARFALPPALHKLSIRHMAVNAGGHIAIAMQYEGPDDDEVPLVALFDGDRLTTLAAPPDMLGRMKQYCGAVALDRSGTIACVSAPRGNLVTFWDLAGRRLAGHVTVADGCGVAATDTSGAFLVSNGYGQTAIAAVDAEGLSLERRHPGFAWDNHIV